MPVRRHELLITPRTVWTVLLHTLLLVGLLALAWLLRGVLTWILVSLLLALAVHPLVEWLHRRRIPRGWSVAIVFVVIGGLLTALFATLMPMFIDQGRRLVQNSPALLERLESWPPLRWLDRRFDIIQTLKEDLQERASHVATPAIGVATRVVQFVAGFITVIVLTVFMLLFGEDVTKGALLWVPGPRRHHALVLARRMRRVVGGYVGGTLLVSSVGGVVMGITLASLGVPYFLALGLVMVVLGIIPFLGSMIGAVLLVGVTFATSGWKAGLICAVVYLVYQQIENHVLQPLVQRKTIKMNPLLIAVVLLVGTSLGGITGALLALPVAGAIQIVLRDALARRQAAAAAAVEPTDELRPPEGEPLDHEPDRPKGEPSPVGT